MIELLLTITLLIAVFDIVLTNRLAHAYKKRLQTLQQAYSQVLAKNAKVTSNTGRIPREVG